MSSASSPAPIIAAVFGALFVVLNGALLGPVGFGVARVLAVVVAVVVVVRALRGHGPAPSDVRRGGFGRFYWLVVLGEAVALFGGLAILGALGASRANLGWIALVVGVHLVVLGHGWHVRGITVVGWTLSVLGIAGLVTAAAGGSVDAVAFVAGFCSGVVILVSCLLLTLPGARARQAGPRAGVS